MICVCGIICPGGRRFLTHNRTHNKIVSRLSFFFLGQRFCREPFVGSIIELNTKHKLQSLLCADCKQFLFAQNSFVDGFCVIVKTKTIYENSIGIGNCYCG